MLLLSQTYALKAINALLSGESKRIKGSELSVQPQKAFQQTNRNIFIKTFGALIIYIKKVLLEITLIKLRVNEVRDCEMTGWGVTQGSHNRD